MAITYCEICGEPTSREVTFGNAVVTLPLACRCKREEQAEFERQDKLNREMLRNSEIIRNGYLDPYYAELTFAKDDSPKSKPSLDLHRYVDKWEAMKANNYGLFMMGSYGTGKTFYAACIANEIRKKGEFVLIGTLSSLIQRMNEDYGRDKSEWQDKIRRYPLMVIDDFGAERDTEYSLEQIENIIDLRYRSRLPLIITSNLSTKTLQNLAQEDVRKGRMVSRISEMCVAYTITGADRRKITAKEKGEEFMRELMGE